MAKPTDPTPALGVEPIKYLMASDARWFIESGLLCEVNRRILHPVGLALEVGLPDDDADGRVALAMWDYRDDPEGVAYSDDLIAPGGFVEQRGRAYQNLLKSRAPARRAALGFLVQPPGR